MQATCTRRLRAWFTCARGMHAGRMCMACLAWPARTTCMRDTQACGAHVWYRLRQHAALAAVPAARLHGQQPICAASAWVATGSNARHVRGQRPGGYWVQCTPCARPAHLAHTALP
ncbi:hypothetical protein PanWU01x14_099950 [Parasponia andersonii]|uniref:Uncharacterized protein n=1 Tax=Parasponia andersonii TaxID=3476 RepID=A0A2P5D3F3_PARAD|nr:hypothetical protein PanWU01x14_099950 [Parasponia andersonii]